MVRHNINKCIDFAKTKLGRCLSSQYKDIKSKMIWRCKFGHQWAASFDSVYNVKTWCPFCAGNIKNTIDDARNLAISNGGECLSLNYKNAYSKLKWKCGKCNYTWEAKYNDIQQGCWCPKCAKNIKLTIVDAYLEAKKNNGTCKSEVYKNARSKLQWECEFGHIWRATLSSVKNTKSWCPLCKLKTQNKLNDLVVSILGADTIQNYRGFEWLRTDSGRKQEIDIWVPEFKLAIEYDGEQHFGIGKYAANAVALERIRYLDLNKERKILEHFNDIKVFIRFTYKDNICFGSVVNKLTDNGITW